MTGYVLSMIGLLVILIGLVHWNNAMGKKFRGIFIDDIRNPSDVGWVHYDPDIQWTIVRTYSDFKDEIRTNGIPKYISFDHDLADYDEDGIEYTGLSCAKYLVDIAQYDNKELPEYIYYHTQNPIGKDNIKGYIESYQVFVRREHED
ncbi:hypothetical protein [Aeromonas phage AS-zj]|uniref:Cyclic-phosphate processing Receiver domain-containing protein n=1 Tax=Aeromonas phage AS-zj TaxID=2024208 RepID=A0A223LEP7_9CAUD|nr:hypothetical protein HWB28_gp099 [Aeromonas phage AS-zj]ASU00453.1 hypothetical protein [Aeromonas phage AS-zj]